MGIRVWERGTRGNGKGRKKVKNGVRQGEGEGKG